MEFTLTPTPEDDEDETEDEEEQPLEVEQDVVEKLGEKMVEFRDLRWAVYREISFVLSSLSLSLFPSLLPPSPPLSARNSALTSYIRELSASS